MGSASVQARVASRLCCWTFSQAMARCTHCTALPLRLSSESACAWQPGGLQRTVGQGGGEGHGDLRLVGVVGIIQVHRCKHLPLVAHIVQLQQAVRAGSTAEGVRRGWRRGQGPFHALAGRTTWQGGGMPAHSSCQGRALCSHPEPVHAGVGLCRLHQRRHGGAQVLGLGLHHCRAHGAMDEVQSVARPLPHGLPHHHGRRRGWRRRRGLLLLLLLLLLPLLLRLGRALLRLLRWGQQLALEVCQRGAATDAPLQHLPSLVPEVCAVRLASLLPQKVRLHPQQLLRDEHSRLRRLGLRRRRRGRRGGAICLLRRRRRLLRWRQQVAVLPHVVAVLHLAPCHTPQLVQRPAPAAQARRTRSSQPRSGAAAWGSPAWATSSGTHAT